MVWVFSEDVPDNNRRFLHDIGDFRRNKLEKGVDAESSGRLDLDGQFAYCSDGLPNEVDVDFCGIPDDIQQSEYVIDFGMAYSRNSVKTSLMFFSDASMKINSSFVTLT